MLMVYDVNDVIKLNTSNEVLEELNKLIDLNAWIQRTREDSYI